MARLCFSLTVIFIVIASLWSSDSFTVLNSLLTGHVFKTIVSIDWLQCVQECHKHDMCISYNYFPPGEICELNNFAFNDRCEAEDNLITANGWIHHAQEIEVKRNTTELSKHLENVTANFTCCHSMEMFADGKSLGEDNGECKVANTFLIPGGTRVISVRGKSTRSLYGILGSFSNGLVTNESWKCSGNFSNGWNSRDYDDRHWPHAVAVGNHGIIPGISKAAKWIWTNSHYAKVYCRLDLQKIAATKDSF